MTYVKKRFWRFRKTGDKILDQATKYFKRNHKGIEEELRILIEDIVNKKGKQLSFKKKEIEGIFEDVIKHIGVWDDFEMIRSFPTEKRHHKGVDEYAEYHPGTIILYEKYYDEPTSGGYRSFVLIHFYIHHLLTSKMLDELKEWIEEDISQIELLEGIADFIASHLTKQKPFFTKQVKMIKELI